MSHHRIGRNERGIALVVVLLVLIAVAALVGGAAVLGSNTSLINKYHDRLSVLETTADAGLEQARSMVNGNMTLYPDTGYNVLESGATVYAADGSVIPDVKRWLYVGPTGVTSGQYGVFGSVVSVTQDRQGNRVVRRSDVYQESFAKYAYYTTIEGAIQFGGGDQLFGPVHSNDEIDIHSTGATFNGPVVTAKTIIGKSFGTFKEGYTENAAPIPMPTTADLAKLKTQAQMGNTAILGNTAGNMGQATTRIEFVALDLNTDGDSADENEGFMKVYQAPAAFAWFVVADTNQYAAAAPNGGVRNSPNCGHAGYNVGGHHGTEFTSFFNHPVSWNSGADSKTNAATVTGAGITRRCYLGGSDILNPGGVFASNDGRGQWLPWSGAVSGQVISKVGPTVAQYLWPINRALNPNFKGVIHVEGKVAVSGRLRGRVTVAATDNIIIADDLRYVTAVGAAGRNCRDILGLFSGQDVVVADNLLNDPIKEIPAAANYVSWDEPGGDEFIDGIALALNIFTVERYNTGANSSSPGRENCGTKQWGRGCLILNGGVIQKQRGAVALSLGTGNVKRYAWDACGAEAPPPYFPTTGRFARGHYYEVEPTGFDIDTYWALLTGG
jgi:hypothetical protein